MGSCQLLSSFRNKLNESDKQDASTQWEVKHGTHRRATERIEAGPNPCRMERWVRKACFEEKNSVGGSLKRRARKW
ncbi:hypothetical protein ZHAS_00008205 [Anopheles sinensis]|uniref:Uncharacterized protein n=1 Tax=Anopheles sinensis TaxID=74873 RepID=A0A084VS31_ANOSI|nr:hypothetical protein ZHAS_00008205 [Anopheles sinensis]